MLNNITKNNPLKNYIKDLKKYNMWEGGKNGDCWQRISEKVSSKLFTNCLCPLRLIVSVYFHRKLWNDLEKMPYGGRSCEFLHFGSSPAGDGTLAEKVEVCERGATVNTGGRIINGEDAVHSNHPWIVYIEMCSLNRLEKLFKYHWAIGTCFFSPHN